MYWTRDVDAARAARLGIRITNCSDRLSSAPFLDMVLSIGMDDLKVHSDSSRKHSFRQKSRHVGWALASLLGCVLVGLWILPGSPGFSRLLTSDNAANERVGGLHHYSSRAAASVLEDFQVYPPVLTVNPAGVFEITDGSSNGPVATVSNSQPSCQQVLVSYSFANSYGSPYVGTVNPPSCSFNRVSWNLTVTAAGRQFDRLAIVYLGDTEVFRTSTAEPTAAGIIWTYIKDMTPYVSLFKQQQKIIFDLGNIVDSTYTSPFNVTLTAAYFTADDSISPADVIIPISSHNSAQGKASVFSLPPDNATNQLTLPRNVQRAVVSLSATGQINEEFWWGNVPSSTVNTFPASGTLLGYSPFREVQLFIDGNLAGVAWPFPIIFTGGVVPGLWRPMVGIDAFDLKEDEIDITPWLPLLCDGKAHNFTIRVAGLNDDGKGNAQLAEVVGSYWLVTGKVFVWLDAANHVTTGTIFTSPPPAPQFRVTSSTTKAADGSNLTLSYDVSAQRSLSTSAWINTSQGGEFVFFQQSRSFDNQGLLSNGGNTEINTQSTTGWDLSSSGYARQISYPLYVNTTYNQYSDGSFYLFADVDRSKNVKTVGASVFPTGLESYSQSTNGLPPLNVFQGTSLQTTQNGTSTYFVNATTNTGYVTGASSQEMSFSGSTLDTQLVLGILPVFSVGQELFSRQVATVNTTVLYDHEDFRSQVFNPVHPAIAAEGQLVLAARPQKPRKPL